jgi:hypothetical protein
MKEVFQIKHHQNIDVQEFYEKSSKKREKMQKNLYKAIETNN